MVVSTIGRLAIGLVSACVASNLVWADPPEPMALGSAVSQIANADSDIPLPISATTDSETVRERFKSGKVHIEKEVVLNSEGNFVNHGSYTEFNEKGELVQSGTFANGVRSGTWIKVVGTNHSKLLDTLPYNQFKPPFQTTAEFENGEMNGVWTISDADNRVISTISLQNGIRHGHANWNLPSGVSLYEADYENGALHGFFIEKDAAGKIVKQLEYNQGSVTQVQRESFPNKSSKSEIQVLTSRPKLVTRDSYDTLTLATYAAEGEATKHGTFVYYHENGTIRTRGTYHQGELDGSFEAWHSNGDRECLGTYANGKLTGKWTWWHANGMRKSSGNYVDGRIQGELLAWDENGKRISPNALDLGTDVANQKSESTTRRR